MRKIEQAMFNAVKARRNWAQGNTKVQFDFAGGRVMLYGHRIAYTDHKGVLTVDVDTLRSYPTATTKSRLRALGFDVYTKNQQIYWNDVAL